MVIRDPGQDRQEALEFAHGALRHYFSVGPDQLMLRERNTGLTTGDLLVSAIEELLDVLDPGGPRPWQHTAPDEQWRPDAADQGTTVTMTEIHGGEAWHPGFPS